MKARSSILLLALLGGCIREHPGDDDKDAADAASPDAAVVDGTIEHGQRQVRIATFNVERFFDDVCDSGNCGPGEFEEVVSRAELRERAAGIASGIRQMNADIVVLAEVESEVAITALLDQLGSHPYHRVSVTNEGNVNTAVISELPITFIASHADTELRRPNGSRTHFTRDFLEVHIDDDGMPIIVFAAHFKAKADDDPGRRQAEGEGAGAIVAAVAEANPDALVVMGGDLNDVPGSPALRGVEAGGALHRVAEDIVPNDGTYRYSGELQAIDHLFLAETDAGAYVPRSAHVHCGNRGFAGSDHCALSAEFTVTH